MLDDPRYPIGEFKPRDYTDELRDEWLADIRFLPQAIEYAITNLDESQLMTPYREGGWTVHKLVHHVADSHINAYCRFKLGLTEHNPNVRPYDENLWVATADVTDLPVNISITLLHALHARWYALLKSLGPNDLARTVYHPGHGKEFTLWELLGMYAWHGRHHVAQITALRSRKGWD